MNKKSILDQYYVLNMSNGEEWAVPIRSIAISHANYYKKDFNGNIEKCLFEYTVPLFSVDHDEIIDWAKNYMSWRTIRTDAIMINKSECFDYERAWVESQITITPVITKR